MSDNSKFNCRCFLDYTHALRTVVLISCITYNFYSLDNLVLYNVLVKSKLEHASVVWNILH
jgi:hypothetical protein